jgi:2'-5' RNA ligase
MQTIRTFIAVPIRVDTQLANVWTKFRQRFGKTEVKWVDPDVLHLTLFFLGETPQDVIVNIQNDITDVLTDFKPFNITLKGLGCFGQKNNPKVIWVGTERNEELTRLHTFINKKVSNFGFKPDERGFNPHITLGRPKHLIDSNAFNNEVGKYVNTVFQVSKANEVIHFKSELNHSGPIYTKLYGITLG